MERIYCSADKEQKELQELISGLKVGDLQIIDFIPGIRFEKILPGIKLVDVAIFKFKSDEREIYIEYDLYFGKTHIKRVR